MNKDGHIPIAAPDIGGMADMITDKQNGRLLSKECNINELVEALSDIDFFKMSIQEKINTKFILINIVIKRIILSF